MTATVELPKAGERVLVRWPGGLYDFVIQFRYAEVVGPGDWVVLHGYVEQPEGVQHQWCRSFYVRPVAPGEWTLYPVRS